MTTLLIFYNDVVDIVKKRTDIWHERITRHGECVASIGSSLNLANHAIVLDTLQRISKIRNDRHL